MVTGFKKELEIEITATWLFSLIGLESQGKILLN